MGAQFFVQPQVTRVMEEGFIGDYTLFLVRVAHATRGNGKEASRVHAEVGKSQEKERVAQESNLEVVQKEQATWLP